jgi:hypothetical protein
VALSAKRIRTRNTAAKQSGYSLLQFQGNYTVNQALTDSYLGSNFQKNKELE